MALKEDLKEFQKTLASYDDATMEAFLTELFELANDPNNYDLETFDWYSSWHVYWRNQLVTAAHMLPTAPLLISAIEPHAKLMLDLQYLVIHQTAVQKLVSHVPKRSSWTEELSDDDFQKALNEYCRQLFEASATIEIVAGGMLIEGVNYDEANNTPDWLNECEATSDFKAVSWYGQPFKFTLKQSMVIEELWKAKNELRSSLVSEQDLLDKCESTTDRLRDVFKSGGKINPAWGTLIVNEGNRIYRLPDGRI